MAFRVRKTEHTGAKHGRGPLTKEEAKAKAERSGAATSEKKSNTRLPKRTNKPGIKRGEIANSGSSGPGSAPGAGEECFPHRLERRLRPGLAAPHCGSLPHANNSGSG